MVSEASESVDVDAKGSKELKGRRPLVRDGFIVWLDTVDKEEVEHVEGVGEAGREVEGGELGTCFGCGVLRAAIACTCRAFRVNLNF